MNIENRFRHWIRTGNVPKRVDFGPHFQDDWRLRYSAIEMADCLYSSRRKVIKQFGFALPCQEAIARLKRLGPFVEVGAGVGAWARLLTKNGIDVIATDKGFQTDYGFRTGRFHPVARMSAENAIRRHPDRDVLMIWPCYGAEWPTKAVSLMKRGRYLALVSEGEGGCVGADSLFWRLRTQFQHIETVYIPCWDGIHDRLDIYRRIIAAPSPQATDDHFADEPGDEQDPRD